MEYWGTAGSRINTEDNGKKEIYTRAQNGCYSSIVLILSQGSIDDRKRLLELFPIATLREVWNVKGTKTEICYAAAADTSAANIARIAKFVDDNFGCCKQHVYVYSHDGTAPLPATVVDGESVLQTDGVRALYLARVTYAIVLRNPLDETTLEFLWPVRVEIRPTTFIVRCVVLEKNPSSYFDRAAYVAGKSIIEKNILAGFLTPGLIPADINKGIKKLWADGAIESIRGDYKKPYSLSSETMDEERGIKEHYPEIYAIMQESPLYTTLFEVTGDNSSVGTFSADPSHGIIGFTSYSAKGDTDAIIEQIISNN